MSKLCVLIVDDTENDLILARAALKKAAPHMDFVTLDRGQDAIDYFYGRGKYSNREIFPIPRLLIVDLKMPEVSGLDVLVAVRQLFPAEPPFVAVMSTSPLAEDREKALSSGATVFHTKPIQFEELTSLFSRLCSFFCAQALASGTNESCEFVGVGK